MAFDGITIAAMVKELNDYLAGGRINKIAQPETNCSSPAAAPRETAACFYLPVHLSP